MNYVTFNLPKPPSINHIYGFTSHGGFARSYITKEGKAWFKAAIAIIQEATKELEFPIEAPVTAILSLQTCRIQDIDNVIKPTLDSMGSCCLVCGEKFTARKACKCGNKKSLLKNDNLVSDLHITKTKTPHKEDELLTVQLYY